MKYFALAALAVTDINADAGALNVHWTEGYACPDFTDATKLVEFVMPINTSNKTFEGFKQECAEAFYGFSQMEVPCLQAMYFPDGMNLTPDQTADLPAGWNPVDGAPYYSCHGYMGEYIVEPTTSQWDELAQFGINIHDENNRYAACINNSPENV